ncbi:MAG: ATP-binding protein [Deltaproteobacteria bacterium]|nr:ATP-binding protein [Deltaproteobacteria bacterium]MCL5277277.1 ATP-binding protein [Deltaproteobacteria bacterium]
MNKLAFLVFSVSFMLTGVIVLLVERGGMELSVSIVLIVSVCMGAVAAWFYGGRVRALLKHIAGAARSELGVYSLPFSSSPGMNDVSSVVKLLIVKARESCDALGRNIEDTRRIIDAVDIGLLVINRRGNVVYANRYIREFAGIGTDITGMYFLDIVRSYEAEALFNSVLSGGPSRQKEISLFAPDERRFSLSIDRIDYCASDRCYLLTLKDITKLRQMEEIRQDFITNASHELKTPLTSIIGYLEALRDGYNRGFIDTAYNNAKRMHRIVEDMLVLSKADRGPSELNMRDVSLLDIVGEVQTLLNNEIAKKRQRLTVDIPGGADIVYGDREALFHVLLNLVDNAVKYSDQDGEIGVRAVLRDREVEVSVHDSGYGIPSNELDRIFERFYTVDKARSRELGGTGLGLSIVRHFVLAHNGRIWVESELNKGSVFRFTIPVKRSPPPAAPAQGNGLTAG